MNLKLESGILFAAVEKFMEDFYINNKLSRNNKKSDEKITSGEVAKLILILGIYFK